MKPRALVIEDVKEQAVLFSQALEWAGYETAIANDGLEGLKRILETVPHLVLLDLHIPKISGEDVFEQIKKNPDLKHIKVILATGDSSLAEKLNESADLVLLKPIDLLQLRDLAARLIDKKLLNGKSPEVSVVSQQVAGNR